MEKVFVILLLMHAWLVFRYCVGNIVTYNDQLTGLKKFKWLTIVLIFPFVGYYLFLKSFSDN